MKILHLTLKKKWFDMIASGEKKEEYREIKPYWINRLYKNHDTILFRNGYSAGSPELLIEFKGFSRSYGLVEWGAPKDKKVYVLKLGEIIDGNR